MMLFRRIFPRIKRGVKHVILPLAILFGVAAMIYFLKVNLSAADSFAGNIPKLNNIPDAVLENLKLNLIKADFSLEKTLKQFHSNEAQILASTKTLEVRNKTLLVLFYTEIFGSRVWHGLQGKKLVSHYKDLGCPAQNCRLTYQKSLITSADAVIFHARDVETHRHGKYSAENLLVARKSAPFSQLWVWLSHENPQDDTSIYTPYKQLFNWTSTFSRKSDVFIPYAKFIRSESSQRPVKNYAKDKTGLVAWAASNCVKMRLEYVQELQRYLNVTVYGSCRKYFVRQKNCAHNSESCKRELSKYKFFLAFENEFCEDYVTEKYWERIYQETVPVVMGGNYDKSIVIPGSYIDASWFGSIMQLAAYLQYLDANDTAYNQYFAWKSHYAVYDGPTTDIHCSICVALNTGKAKRSNIMTLSDVFNKAKTCYEPFRTKRDKVEKQIEDSKRFRKIFAEKYLF